MSVESLAFDLARSLTAADIDYMLVGSFASNQFGIPRSTKDADFVVDVPSAKISILYEILEPAWKVAEQITFESITGSKRLDVRHQESEFLIQKLRWGRPKDIDDAGAVISVQANRLDFSYIEGWCSKHGTLDRLTAIRAWHPPDLGGTC